MSTLELQMYVHRLQCVGDLVDVSVRSLFICYPKRPDKFDKLPHGLMLMENGDGISSSEVSTVSTAWIASPNGFICM